ncbi:RagB/SusD family nutrient uptake outer membrane protein [Sphingobacterium pedocola]|uniref:RagB/SusD family nutrient uptake outer membrane protein n=1 Tax=Sphingobacterium pedocola TaxID=2082722 RepID=A0ABR9TBM0_9SPHI|nr:RagB/SusD family nutrient uptake outer membrane protein [Sphingobacterium pedocola]MBE8722733.1 RagB/SusD family nutrient uptake outer membrane protein [Sphingobacterium pedocola]
MKLIYKILPLVLLFVVTGCDKFLDRPDLTVENDQTYWRSEDNIRLYANQYYPVFFSGYGRLNNSQDAAPLLSFTNSDDVLSLGNQANVTLVVPNSGIWNYEHIRSTNIMIDRVSTRMDGILSEEAKNHWVGIGRFLRAYRYSELVLAYGDIPYYDREVLSNEREELYKDRTDRDIVMDGVYDDLVYAMANTRLNDGAQFINRYVVAGFASRIALFEGSWQKYYYNNNERAKKFFDLAITAGDLVIQSAKYGITMDYKAQFTSNNLASTGSKDVLLYREYNAALGITHAIVSASNLVESLNIGPTTDLLKAYICTDGKPWEMSQVSGANDFDVQDLVRTRDSRLEATFLSQPYARNNASLVYVTKFLPRDGEAHIMGGGADQLTQYRSTNNETDYPVLRYAEVLLNWIEAKAEAATVGGSAVTQEDLTASVNVIRNRPLAAEAVARGVSKTSPLMLANIPADPNKDGDVSDLIWEIRRERRMEFTFEYSRLVDLRRWGKIQYLDTEANSDLLSGGWVNFPVDLQSFLSGDRAGTFMVADLDGDLTTYDGGNNSSMRGFYRNTRNEGRRPFLNQPNLNPYLQPVGINQINEYKAQGYTLSQTEGWQ